MASSSSSQPLGLVRKGDLLAGCGADEALEEQSVDRPSLGEMIEICQKYSIPFVAENKAYSRDWLTRGRLRVNLNAVEEETVNTKIQGLKSRADRLAKEASHLASLERMQEKEAKKANKKKK